MDKQAPAVKVVLSAEARAHYERMNADYERRNAFWRAQWALLGYAPEDSADPWRYPPSVSEGGNTIT